VPGSAPVKTGEVVRMKESYGEGVAIHTGPESCADAREGGGEALVRGTCRLGIEPRNTWNSGVPTPLLGAEGHVRRIASARCSGTPRGLRPRACTETPRTGTGRLRVRIIEPLRCA
jgi:hypothetical protein